MKSFLFSVMLLVVLITACTSSKENTGSIVQKYVAEKIPPGTAIVEAEVKSIEENSNVFELNVQIKKINGYGPSTKPIVVNLIMKVTATKTLLSAEHGKDFLKTGSVYELEISQPSKTMDGSTESNWNVNAIKKI